MNSGNIENTCPSCGKPLTVADKKKRGLALMACSIILGPIFWFNLALLFLVWAGIFCFGVYWFFKKERFVFVCKTCISVYKQESLRTVANQSPEIDA